MSIASSIISGLFGVLKQIALPLLAYFQGKKAKVGEINEAQLEQERKENRIEEDNIAKSDADILNELRQRDRRGK